MPKTISKKQMTDYEQLCIDRLHGRILTPDGLRTICASYNYDPEAIGRHFLELLPKICPPGSPETDLTEDETVEFIASQVLEAHKSAFEELSK